MISLEGNTKNFIAFRGVIDAGRNVINKYLKEFYDCCDPLALRFGWSSVLQTYVSKLYTKHNFTIFTTVNLLVNQLI